MVSRGDGARFHSVGSRSGRSTHVVRAGALQRLNTAQTIVRRVTGMRVKAENNPAPRSGDGRVETGRYNASTVGEHANARVFGANSIEDFAGSVVAHTVGDDRLPVHATHVLPENRAYELLDVARLIAAGADDGNIHALVHAESALPAIAVTGSTRPQSARS